MSGGFNFPTATTVSSAPPVGGFSFSSPATTTAPTFNFGAPAAAAAPIGGGGGGIGGATSFSFGSTNPNPASAAPTLNFGATPQQQQQQQQQTPSLGLIAQQAPAAGITAIPAPSIGGTGLGASTGTTGGFSFGTQPATTNIVGSGGGSIAAAAAAPSASANPGAPPLFSFGSSLGAKTTASTLTLGTITTCQPSGLAPAPSIALPQAGIGVVSTTTTTTSSIGLGGISLTSSQQKSEQKTDIIAVKENKVPQEILKTVDDLKSYIKQQKTISSEIARTSVRKISIVSNDIEKLNYELQEILDSIQTNYNQIKLLRNETSKAIQNVEMARQTADTPINLQYENQAPLKYFQELIQKYENDLIFLRKQIELTERQMKSLTHPQQLTPDDLKRGLKQIHECFIALAGRLYEIHRRVENVKEQYIHLRSNIVTDTTQGDPFDDIDNDGLIKTTESLDISKIGTGGPSPFSMLSGANFGRFGLNTGNGGGGSGTTGNVGGGITGPGSTIGISGVGSSMSNIGGFGKSAAFGFGADKAPSLSLGAIGASGFSGFGSASLVGGLGTSTISGGIDGDSGLIGTGGLNLQKPPSAKRTKQ